MRKAQTTEPLLIGSGCVGWGKNPDDLQKVARINFSLPDRGVDLRTVSMMAEGRLRQVLDTRYRRHGEISVFVFVLRNAQLFPCAGDPKHRDALRRYSYGEFAGLADSAEPEIAGIYTDLHDRMSKHIKSCSFCRGEGLYFRAERNGRLIAAITDHDFRDFCATQLQAFTVPAKALAAAGIGRA